MNQNVMNWRNQKGMPEIEKIIADSYGERYVGKCNNTTFVIKCGTTKKNGDDIISYLFDSSFIFCYFDDCCCNHC